MKYIIKEGFHISWIIPKGSMNYNGTMIDFREGGFVCKTNNQWMLKNPCISNRPLWTLSQLDLDFWKKERNLKINNYYIKLDDIILLPIN